MEALNVAIASDSIEITSFIPTKVILTLPQLYYLQKHNYINVTNRKCNKRKCNVVTNTKSYSSVYLREIKHCQMVIQQNVISINDMNYQSKMAPPLLIIK